MTPTTLFALAGRRLLPLVAALAMTSTALAESKYVTDQTEITLRSGQSTRHAIKRMLPSGARVELLETDEDSGYTRVLTDEGTDGWVLTRMLMDQPAARDQLASMRLRLDRVEEENRQLRTQIDSLQQANDTLAEELSGLEGQNTVLTRDLDDIRSTSRNALAIASENDTLKSRVADNEDTIELLMAENKQLKAHTTQRWFLIGAGVIVSGILLGLVLPRMRPRRRSSWGSL